MLPKRAGYAVPSALLDNWVSYQRELARSSDANNDYYSEVAAYRLYTLALADKAELPAMNRLREKLIHLNAESDLSSRWLLGSAKARPGKSMSEKLANELLDAFNGTGATIKRREDTHRMAEANRAFSHFRV